jgi:DNA gyrase subunit B
MSDKKKAARVEGEYTHDDIKMLRGVTAIRTRPGMYLGVGEAAVYQCFYEVLANSLDEALAGHARRIDVELHDNGALSISDDGRGIPWKSITDPDGNKIAACVAAATETHAGGKFKNDAYAVSAGTNGVGLTSVNAVSLEFRLETTRDGATCAFECERGEVTKKLFRMKETRKHTGTVVRFVLDPTILVDVPMRKTTSGSVPAHDAARIAQTLRTASYLNPGLRLSLKREKGAAEVFQSKEGLAELVRSQRKSAKRILPEPLRITGRHNGVDVDVSFNWDNSGDEWCEAYANGVLTAQGGTHLTGFRLALSRSVAEAIKQHGLLEGKNKDLEVTGEDCREGLVVALAVRLPEPKFHSQTKDCLGNREAQGATQKLTGDFLSHLFSSDPKAAKTIAARAVAAARGRIAARRARDVARRDSMEGAGLGLPSKLADCLSGNPEECELFLVEGDSAGGSAEQARDRRTQAILKMRGKVLNTHNMDGGQILRNEEIKSIVAALGCGIGEDCDPAKLRYGKVIFMADADVDGAHIVCLLLTLFFKHMRPLIDAGRIYIAQSPLYVVKKAGRIEAFLLDEDARADWEMRMLRSKYEVPADMARAQAPEAELAEATRGYSLGYIKGLGELNPEDLGETTLSRTNRTLLRVGVEDAEAAAESLRVLMDSNAVEPRKAFITERALDATLDM